jgi:hypothetical protein
MSDISGGYVVRESLRSQFGFLFLSLLLAIAIPPLLPSGPLVSIIFAVLLTAVLLSGLFAVVSERTHFMIGAAMVAPALVLSWWGEAVGSLTLDTLGTVFAVVFFCYLTWLILLHIIVARSVNADIIFAAICVYMLIGWICGLGFDIIEVANGEVQALAGGASSRALQSGEGMYYSLVTLTTLGYGDITPVSRVARSLAVLEAVAGQLFLVVMIARLVGLQIAHSGKSE